MRMSEAKRITTNDGREWIATEQGGGWELHEIIEVEGGDYLEQHDAVEGDYWSWTELTTYLKAVGC